MRTAAVILNILALLTFSTSLWLQFGRHQPTSVTLTITTVGYMFLLSSWYFYTA